MGSLLATVLLAVPLTAWLGGTFLFDAPHLRLARISNVPWGIFPIPRKSNSSAIASRRVSNRAARRWMG